MNIKEIWSVCLVHSFVNGNALCVDDCRSVQPNSSSFHRSVSQPVGMEMSGLNSVGWNVGGGNKSSGVTGNNLGGNNFGQPSASITTTPALWRGTSCVPLNTGMCC
jgi:hypothetical protein